MNNIYLATEEFLSIDNIQIILRTHFEMKGYDHSFNNVSVEQTAVNKYSVNGVSCKEVKNIEILIASGSGSFVDVLVYESQNGAIITSKTPDSFWEITKNSPKESGNMTSQRLSKATTVFQQYGTNTLFYYLIDHHAELNNDSVTNLGDREFGKFEAMGAIVLFTHKGSTDVLRYNSNQVPNCLQDLEHIGKTNKLTIDSNDNVVIESNLYKNKEEKTGVHDPNQGWVCGSVYLAKLFGANSIVLKSNKDLTKLRGTSKLIKNLNNNNVIVHYKNKPISLKKSNNSKSYWSMERTGEKLTTISLHQFVLNNGYDIIFSNHAGCEKSFLKLIDGKQVQPSGSVSGIPDLVYADHKGKILFVIEGEREINYYNGVKQVMRSDFQEWIKKQLKSYKGYEAKIYIVTNGRKNIKKGYNFYSSFEGELNMFNKKAKPVYTIQL